MKKILFCVVILLFQWAQATLLNAQTLGSFDTTVTFMSGTRTLSFYVPSTYTSNTPHKLMICLHGLGDNSANYRNALINSLAWNVHFPNTIFVCPEANTTSSDYYYPSGAENIIQTSISQAIAKYNIDTNHIVLQGFSLGGRAALRYGLDHALQFKGLFLNTPAVQGVKNALNNIPSYSFNYSSPNKIPIYITWGTSDYLYESAIDSVEEKLIWNDHKVHLDTISGLGHTIPSIMQMLNVYDYFNQPNSSGLDIAVSRIKMNDRTCNNSTQAQVLIRNLSNVSIQNVVLEYVINGNTQTQLYNGNLQPFEHAIVTLPSFPLISGKQMLDVAVKFINTSITDTFTSNNHLTKDVILGTPAMSFPLIEAFDGTNWPPDGWLVERYGEDWNYWDWDDQVFLSGTHAIYSFNSPFIFDNVGRHADIQSPVFNLSSSSNASLSFDYAFNYLQYTKPTAAIDTIFTDTLEVQISTDCGSTWQSTYKKWGSQLATFAQPILNAPNVNACFISPADTNWRHEEINLNNYLGATEAIIRFRYSSGLGGNIELDNVRFSNYPMVTSSAIEPKINVFPNPAADRVYLNGMSMNIHQLNVTDLQGNVIFKASNIGKGSTFQMDTKDWRNGFYIMDITMEDQTHLKNKITIAH